MIGGVQRFNAIMKINEMTSVTGRSILTRQCAVYSSGLTRTAALVLARQHNEINQIQRTTSFPEVAASCRRLLFSHFAEPGTTDNIDTDLTIPRYNSLQYRRFKHECLMTFQFNSQMVCTVH